MGNRRIAGRPGYRLNRIVTRQGVRTARWTRTAQNRIFQGAPTVAPADIPTVHPLTIKRTMVTQAELTAALTTAKLTADLAIRRAAESDPRLIDRDHSDVVEVELQRLAAEAMLHRRRANQLLENAGVEVDRAEATDAFNYDVVDGGIDFALARINNGHAYAYVEDAALRRQLIADAQAYSRLEVHLDEDGNVRLYPADIEVSPVDAEIALLMESIEMFSSRDDRLAWIAARREEGI